MGLRSLKHEMLNEIDIHYLLTKFSKNEIALIFKVHPDYISKVKTSQRIAEEEKFNNKLFKDVDELRLGKDGAWMNSKERKYIKQFKK